MMKAKVRARSAGLRMLLWVRSQTDQKRTPVEMKAFLTFCNIFVVLKKKRKRELKLKKK
jgi:hypothetical protein